MQALLSETCCSGAFRHRQGVRPGALTGTEFPANRVERVRDIRVQTRLTLTGLDLVATSVAAFVAGWIFGYLATVT